MRTTTAQPTSTTTARPPHLRPRHEQVAAPRTAAPHEEQVQWDRVLCDVVASDLASRLRTMLVEVAELRGNAGDPVINQELLLLDGWLKGAAQQADAIVHGRDEGR